MTRETRSVFFACATGALIGSLLMLEFSGWMTPLGTLVGGFVGYLAYDPVEVGRGIGRAFKLVATWRPNHLSWKLYFSILGWLVASLATLMIIPLSAAYVSFAVEESSSPIAPLMPYIYLGGLLCCLTFSLSAAVAETVPILKKRTIRLPDEKNEGPLRRFETEEEYYERVNSEAREFRAKAMRIAPWMVPYWVFWMLPCWAFKLLAFVVLNTPQWTIRFMKGSWKVLYTITIGTKNFAAIVFRYIHSDMRVLCFVDAVLGSLVGFYFGNPLIGAIAGGLLGVVNYKIVSRRILKINPKVA